MSKDGKIEVNYHVGDRIDQNGEKVQVIEYTAVTVTEVPLQQCFTAMRDVSLHKAFMGDTEESKEIKANYQFIGSKNNMQSTHFQNWLLFLYFLLYHP